MTEGGISRWAIKEGTIPTRNTPWTIREQQANAETPGDTFSAGDVLLEVETDKAQMDVEAQDDGILAKIIVHTPAANLPPFQSSEPS